MDTWGHQHVAWLRSIHSSIHLSIIGCVFCIAVYFSLYVFVKTFPLCSHTVLISQSFLLYPFQSLLCLLAFSLFTFLFSCHSFKKNPPHFSLTLHFFHGFLLFFPPPCPRLCLLSVSQSRIPGTLIPLCAAQCERIFNTTRIAGEETGKETELCTCQQRWCSIHKNVWTQAVNEKPCFSFWLHSVHC